MEGGDYANTRVLVVDDQREIHTDFDEMLRPTAAESRADDLAAAFLPEEGRVPLPHFELLHAMSGEDACAVVEAAREESRPVALAYVDVRMPPGIDGLETIRRIRRIDREVELVIMTAYTDRHLSEVVRNMELLHKLLYIRKPFAREEVQQITLSLVAKWNVEREIVLGRQRLEAVLDATGDAIAMYDGAGRLEFANRWYEKLFELAGSDLEAMSAEAASTRFEEWYRESGAPGLIAGGEGGQLVRKPGADRESERRLFHRSKRPVHDNRENVIGDLFVYRDVSREIEVETMKAEVLRLRSELETTWSFDGILGSSGPMQRLYGLMKRAVEGDGLSILVRGESGTGKELVARCLHFNGPRKAGPFIPVNCAAVPEPLFESELFGHERGAFTGATARRIGYFERAEGGTILLDEIGDMQPAVQAKLLRVLQEREIQRLGGTDAIPIDVQVFAATNQDLEEAIAAGRFREDLYWRIASFPIVIPPLRERREDIPELAEYFLKRHAERSRRSIRGLSTGALRRLLSYDWPGNVRELEGAIGRAVLMETGDVLQEGSLPPLAPVSPADRGPPAADARRGVQPLVEVERQALAHALETCGNNVTRAARALGDPSRDPAPEAEDLRPARGRVSRPGPRPSPLARAAAVAPRHPRRSHAGGRRNPVPPMVDRDEEVEIRKLSVPGEEGQVPTRRRRTFPRYGERVVW